MAAPPTGSSLPTIVFLHSFGSSLNGYDSLADFWAAHGFVVIQPPGLSGRLDPSRIAAAGHSFDGQTAGSLLGLRVLDPVSKKERTYPTRGSRQACFSQQPQPDDVEIGDMTIRPARQG
jgi:predicted dienelactone hydrolase